MEINVNHTIRIICEVPFYIIDNFSFYWDINCHAKLSVKGCINQSIQYMKEALYNSKICVRKDCDDRQQIIFYGYVSKVSEIVTGGLIKIFLEAVSGSYLLDQKLIKRSFRMVENTYADIINEAVQGGNGKVICTAGNEKQIQKPIIQYQETVWDFCKRMAGHLGTCLVADVQIGESALWFGMRNGDNIPPLLENEYIVKIRRMDNCRTDSIYQIESRDFYKIGDKTIFCGKKLIICTVTADFKDGELVFTYFLKEKETTTMTYNELFIGLGLAGTVIDVRDEQIKIALDIDNGISTGNYFYNWYPETGNALYAMPEIGARVMLCFEGRDEREGFVLNCLRDDFRCGAFYSHRHLYTNNGCSMNLPDDKINFTARHQCFLTSDDEEIIVHSFHNVYMLAKEGIYINADSIFVRSSDELSFCQS